MYKFYYKNSIIKGNFNISSFSSFNIGNTVKYFSEIKSFNALKEILEFSRERALRIFFLGGGTNILFPDKPLSCIIIKNSLNGIKKLQNNEIEALSGSKLADVIEFSIKNSLSGIEKLFGIPGTIGGALCGNAGAYGEEIMNSIKTIYSINTEGKTIKRNKKNIKYSYRQSEYKTNGEFIYKAILKLKKGAREKIKQIAQDIKKIRESKTPPNIHKTKCAGSFFKNIILDSGEKIAAGKLLENINAKGITIGDAKVSEHHANFIINQNNAKSEDIKKLASLLKKKVKEKYGYDLTEEVVIVEKFI